MRKRRMNKIKEVLKEKGKTQQWLADQIGVSRQIVGRYCSNINQPLIETLFDIAEALEVTPAELLGSGEEMK